MITPQDIESEHRAAIASLTPAQHRAIARLRNAKQATHFNGRFHDENLRNMFEREAEARNIQIAEMDERRRVAA